jgi:lysophospholipase L1-like esterase
MLAGVLATGILIRLNAPAGDAGPTRYYVALGDSLSRGYLPGSGDTDQGYVDYVYLRLHAKDPSLQLVKLGCNGETTATMINGGTCGYAGGGWITRNLNTILSRLRAAGGGRPQSAGMTYYDPFLP